MWQLILPAWLHLLANPCPWWTANRGANDLQITSIPGIIGHTNIRGACRTIMTARDLRRANQELLNLTAGESREGPVLPKSLQTECLFFATMMLCALGCQQGKATCALALALTPPKHCRLPQTNMLRLMSKHTCALGHVSFYEVLPHPGAKQRIWYIDVHRTQRLVADCHFAS